MPQLDPEFFISQLFWLLVSFSFLLIFLWRISLPRISSVLEKRESKINNDIESAKKLQTEAEEIQIEIEKKLDDAREEANNLIKITNENLQYQASKELLKIDEELEEKLEESSIVLKKNKEESLLKIHKDIYEITKLAMSKLSSIKVTEEDIKKSVSEANQKMVN